MKRVWKICISKKKDVISAIAFVLNIVPNRELLNKVIGKMAEVQL